MEHRYSENAKWFVIIATIIFIVLVATDFNWFYPTVTELPVVKLPVETEVEVEPEVALEAPSEDLSEEKEEKVVVAPQPIVSCKYWDSVINSKTKPGAMRRWAKRVMRCESGCNEWAENPNSYATGLFQFMPATYRGNGGTDIWNGHQQIDIAIRMYNLNQQYQWVCK